jgi:hypothetical protein
MTADKYEYEYDEEGRKNLLIESFAGADLDWVPNKKTTTIWFDDDYISDRVYYSYNGTKWDPQTRATSPDHGQPDKFTTIHFKWDTANYEWDTTSKAFSYLNEENKVTAIYTYERKQGEWEIVALITKDYSASGKILFVRMYSSDDNGETYDFTKLYEYEYNLDDQLTDLWERWDGWDIWYRDRWTYDEYGRYWRQYYFKRTPVHPESQGGIVFKYYYDDLNLIHHRNVFNCYTETHYANDFYYYSLFTVKTEDTRLKSSVLSTYPNPFTTSTTIEFELQQAGNVQISIYNQLGEVVDVISKNQSHGKQQVIWDTNGLPSGMYYYQVQIGNKRARGKMVKLGD